MTASGRSAPLRGADISACGSYRYRLWRTWDPHLQRVHFVGLNPSTADASEDDPTIRKMMGFAARWGCGGIMVTNLFAYRATDPRELDRCDVNPSGGTRNMIHWQTAAAPNALVVACWGVEKGQIRSQAVAFRSGWVREDSRPLHHLGLTQNGSPKHPLYLRGDTLPRQEPATRTGGRQWLR